MTPQYLYRMRVHKLTQDIQSALENCDPDAIHDVRVSIRRMVMLCSILKRSGKAPYSKKELRILKTKFKRAGALRDIQVQLQLITVWEKELQIRFDQYKKYLERREKTLQQYFKRAFQTLNLRKLIPDGVRRLSFCQDIEKELQSLDADFRQKSQTNHPLHPLRITAKKLKYLLEVQQACYPGFGSTETFRKYLAHLQDLLGSWHDVEMGLQQVTRLVNRNIMKTEDPLLHSVLIDLMKKEKEEKLSEIQAELLKQIPMKERLSVVLT